MVFDGVCNFCNGAVQFIIKRDPQRRFVFSPVQSPYAQALLSKYGIADLGLETFVLVEGDAVYLRTDAALRIAPKLGGAWFLFLIFRLLPARFRDFFYKAFAKRRYRLFGHRQSCMLPTPELSSRFRLPCANKELNS